MKNLFFVFLADESGASAIEYALLITFIAMVIIAGAATLGSNLSRSYNNMADSL